MNALSKLVPDIFTRDPDMMAIALVNDTATMSMSTSAPSDGARAWGTPRIGQVALLVELVDRFQQAHDAKDLAMVRLFRHRMNCRSHYAYQTSAYVKFATTLEHRLGIAIEAKVCPNYRTLVLRHCSHVRAVNRRRSPTFRCRIGYSSVHYFAKYDYLYDP